MKSAKAIMFLLAACAVSPAFVPDARGQDQPPQRRVTFDFTEVELPVFVRFMSELTGKTFVLDEKAAGKFTAFSPTKVTVDQAYGMFLAALEANRLTAIPRGSVIQIVQASEAPPERGVFVYRLRHANAVEAATVLTNLVAKSQAVPVSTGGRPPIRPLNEFGAPVMVFADKATNSLIISSTKEAYDRLFQVIQDLDTRRKQVFVEVAIMEVSLDRLRKIGNDPAQAIGVFQVTGNQGTLNATGGFNIAPENLGQVALALSGATGAATTVNSVNLRAFMQLLMNLTDVNILSTPQVLASDNQKAKIVVGENRPFPTGQAQGITGGTLVTVERKDVGVTLEMTPQVLENDLIRLEIKQEITAINENISQTIGQGNASVPVGPTTTKRSMETITVAHNQQTIVVGGLMRDDLVINESKIPLLGDIPLLGWLFKTQSKLVTKLSLLVFLTPHLIKDEVDMVELNTNKAVETEAVRRQQTNITEPTGAQQKVAEQLLKEPPPREKPAGAPAEGNLR
jgi:general secretion pathway protein D